VKQRQRPTGHTVVMAGLVPAIHAFRILDIEDVDARHEAGHDESERAAVSISLLVRFSGSVRCKT